MTDDEKGHGSAWQEDDGKFYTMVDGEKLCIPDEAFHARNNLTYRQNSLLNVIGIMALLDSMGERSSVMSIMEFVFEQAHFTHPEFDEVAELHNQLVEVVLTHNGKHDITIEEVLNGQGG